ncbi:hypothetical protein [Pyrobaculum neutrophilum]|uniref:Uncharacterized protein n=1 Tax=Pyrobaculum neutrophilum (strain DSM 2338 / JCM 9278 / NBRC 100436 / V24Sta) TaxID=444157 RepID=B1YDD9_PYRNV|nr:hypothetical protein [Pyrobaculum neutrophilum]ACB39802.1 conserved hypothetical protein [Pyrobaculum neutrophilum V24Sta]
MIPRDDIIAGVASTPLLSLLSELEEVKPSQRIRPLFDFLAEVGLMQRKGDKYRRASLPSRGELSPLAEAVSTLFQNLVFPYVAAGRRAGRLSPELQRALYVYTSAFQALRVTVAQELMSYGGLTLVAGWFPCGFSSELMSIAGRDLVIVEEREDVVALEVDRLSLLPIASGPLGQELAPASFYAFETLPLAGLGEVAEKYGVFDAAVVCHRGADLALLQKIAREVYYIVIRDRQLSYLATAIVEALGLAGNREEPPRRAQREEVGPFDVYILRGAGPT